MAQLIERSLPTPEVCSLNPVISKLLYGTFVYCQLYGKDENKEKEAGMAVFLKKPKTKRKTKCIRILSRGHVRLNTLPFKKFLFLHKF